MLSAIFYGSYYGGTITTVLMGVPGESASAITMLDGYQMAKQGRGGAALSVAAIGSFLGDIFSVLGLVVAAPVLGLDLGLADHREPQRMTEVDVVAGVLETVPASTS